MMALYIANGLRTIMIDDKNKIYTHNVLHVPVYTVIVVYSVLYVQRGSLLYCLYLYGCTVYILYELEQKENPSGNYQKFRIIHIKHYIPLLQYIQVHVVHCVCISYFYHLS
jgi:hypothetical protein